MRVLGFMGSFLAGGGSFAACFNIGLGAGNMATSMMTTGFVGSVLGVFNKYKAKNRCRAKTTTNSNPATRRDLF